MKSALPRDAQDLHADALVWDMTLPIITPGRPERKRDVFSRFVAGDLEVEAPALRDTALPEFGVAALGVFLGVERRVPEIANEKSQLFVGGPLDGGRSVAIRALESARRDRAHESGC